MSRLRGGSYFQALRGLKSRCTYVPVPAILELAAIELAPPPYIKTPFDWTVVASGTLGVGNSFGSFNTPALTSSTDTYEAYVGYSAVKTPPAHGASDASAAGFDYWTTQFGNLLAADVSLSPSTSYQTGGGQSGFGPRWGDSIAIILAARTVWPKIVITQPRRYRGLLKPEVRRDRQWDTAFLQPPIAPTWPPALATQRRAQRGLLLPGVRRDRQWDVGFYEDIVITSGFPVSTTTPSSLVITLQNVGDLVVSFTSYVLTTSPAIYDSNGLISWAPLPAVWDTTIGLVAWVGVVMATGTTTIRMNIVTLERVIYVLHSERFGSAVSWTIVAANSFDTVSPSTTVTWPNLTTLPDGDHAYVGYAIAGNLPISGLSAGFYPYSTVSQDMGAFATNLIPNTSYQPTASQSPAGNSGAVGLIVRAFPTGGGPLPPIAAQRRVQRGWPRPELLPRHLWEAPLPVVQAWQPPLATQKRALRGLPWSPVIARRQGNPTLGLHRTSITLVEGLGLLGSIFTNPGVLSGVSTYAVGDEIVLFIVIVGGADSVSSITCGAITFDPAAVRTLQDATTGRTIVMWRGIVTQVAQASATITINRNNTDSANVYIYEFQPPEVLGQNVAWNVIASNTASGSGSTVNWPNLTSSGAQYQAYIGFARAQANLVDGSGVGVGFNFPAAILPPPITVYAVYDQQLPPSQSFAPTMSISSSTGWDAVGMILAVTPLAPPAITVQPRRQRGWLLPEQRSHTTFGLHRTTIWPASLSPFIGTGSTLNITTQNIGDIVVLFVAQTEFDSFSSVSSSNVSWGAAVGGFTQASGSVSAITGIVTAIGSDTITVTPTGGSIFVLSATEFEPPEGYGTPTWIVENHGGAGSGSSSTISYPSLTSGNQQFEAYIAFSYNASAPGVPTAGGTSGFNYFNFSNSQTVINQFLAPSTSYAPVGSLGSAGAQAIEGIIIALQTQVPAATQRRVDRGRPKPGVLARRLWDAPLIRAVAGITPSVVAQRRTQRGLLRPPERREWDIAATQPGTSAGCAAPVFRAATSNAANSTAFTITIPASVQVGDLMLIGYFYRDPSTETAPTGWQVAVLDTVISNNHSVVYFRYATAGDTGGATTVAFNDTFSGSAAVFVAYSGAVGIDPVPAATTGTGTAITSPSTSTSAPNRQVVTFMGQPTGGTFNNQVTMPAISRVTTFAGHACAGAADFVQVAPTFTPTQAGTLSGSDTWAAMTVPIFGCAPVYPAFATQRRAQRGLTRSPILPRHEWDLPFAGRPIVLPPVGPVEQPRRPRGWLRVTSHQWAMPWLAPPVAPIWQPPLATQRRTQRGWLRITPHRWDLSYLVPPVTPVWPPELASQVRRQRGLLRPPERHEWELPWGLPPNHPWLRERDGSFTTAATTSITVTWKAGDVIVLVTGDGGTLTYNSPFPSISMISGSPLVLTVREDTEGGSLTDSSSRSRATMWTAQPQTDGSATISTTNTGNPGADVGVDLYAWVWANADGVGNVALSDTTAQSVAVTPQRVNSAFSWALFDFGHGTVGPGSVIPTYQRADFSASGDVSLFDAEIDNQTSVGSTSYGGTGLTSGGPYSIVVAEILAKSAGPQAIAPIVAVQRRAQRGWLRIRPKVWTVDFLQPPVAPIWQPPLSTQHRAFRGWHRVRQNRWDLAWFKVPTTAWPPMVVSRPTIRLQRPQRYRPTVSMGINPWWITIANGFPVYVCGGVTQIRATTNNIGDVVILFVLITASGSHSVTTVSSANITWDSTALLTGTDSNTGYEWEAWRGIVQTVGPDTVTVTVV